MQLIRFDGLHLIEPKTNCESWIVHLAVTFLSAVEIFTHNQVPIFQLPFLTSYSGNLPNKFFYMIGIA